MICWFTQGNVLVLQVRRYVNIKKVVYVENIKKVLKEKHNEIDTVYSRIHTM